MAKQKKVLTAEQIAEKKRRACERAAKSRANMTEEQKEKKRQDDRVSYC